MPSCSLDQIFHKNHARLVQWNQRTDGLLSILSQVWQGLEVVKTARVMIGETNPADSKPGTIRGDFCIEVGK